MNGFLLATHSSDAMLWTSTGIHTWLCCRSKSTICRDISWEGRLLMWCRSSRCRSVRVYHFAIVFIMSRNCPYIMSFRWFILFLLKQKDIMAVSFTMSPLESILHIFHMTSFFVQLCTKIQRHQLWLELEFGSTLCRLKMEKWCAMLICECYHILYYWKSIFNMIPETTSDD